MSNIPHRECGRSFKREIDVRSKGNISKGVRTKDIRPGRYFFGGNDDPEVFLRVMNEQDAFLLGGADVPGFSEELDGAGGADAAREVQSEMQIEECWDGHRFEFGSFFFECFVPGLVGRQARGAVEMGLVIVGDFGFQQLVGVVVVLDFLVGKERDDALLKRAEKTFDFAFGLRGWSHAMIDAKSRQSALKLAGCIQTVLRGGVAEEA